jgi:hypothetical protein
MAAKEKVFCAFLVCAALLPGSAWAQEPVNGICTAVRETI